MGKNKSIQKKESTVTRKFRRVKIQPCGKKIKLKSMTFESIPFSASDHRINTRFLIDRAIFIPILKKRSLHGFLDKWNTFIPT